MDLLSRAFALVERLVATQGASDPAGDELITQWKKDVTWARADEVSATETLAWMLECHLATISGMVDVKRSSKTEIRRHISIAITSAKTLAAIDLNGNLPRPQTENSRFQTSNSRVNAVLESGLKAWLLGLSYSKHDLESLYEAALLDAAKH